jgi:KDO2-lipid IV(A) lauroyltransferase
VPLYVAVVAGTLLVTWMPRRLAYAMGSAAGYLSYHFFRGSRRALLGNLAVVFDRPTTNPAVKRTALANFRNNGKNWIDSLRLATATSAEIQRRVRVEGWKLLEDASSSGKGVIMIGSHLGNVDVVGQIMAARGYGVTVPVERMRPEALFRRTQRLRQRLGIRTVEASSASRELLRALDEKRVVALLADRNLSDSGLEVVFFGKPAIVSRGPAWLVSRTDAPVLVGTGLRRPDGTFDGLITELHVQRTGDRRADERINAHLIMRAIEARVADHPEQWSMYVPFWKDSGLTR